ncbi:unnamed protein product [Aphanomyces euteiches]
MSINEKILRALDVSHAPPLEELSVIRTHITSSQEPFFVKMEIFSMCIGYKRSQQPFGKLVYLVDNSATPETLQIIRSMSTYDRDEYLLRVTVFKKMESMIQNWHENDVVTVKLFRGRLYGQCLQATFHSIPMSVASTPILSLSTPTTSVEDLTGKTDLANPIDCSQVATPKKEVTHGFSLNIHEETLESTNKTDCDDDSSQSLPTAELSKVKRPQTDKVQTRAGGKTDVKPAKKPRTNEEHVTTMNLSPEYMST